MLAPNPVAGVTWPVAGDVPDLLNIVTDQAQTVAANEALLHAYQTNLNTAQNPLPGPAATANGSPVTASTSIVVTGTTGTIVQGATVTGTPNPAPPIVLGQVSGTPPGTDGTYLLSAPVTFAGVTALTFTPPAAPFPGTWPVPRDVTTLNLIVQEQTAVIRTQTALIQHYQDLLNTSAVPAPPTGP